MVNQLVPPDCGGRFLWLIMVLPGQPATGLCEMIDRINRQECFGTSSGDAAAIASFHNAAAAKCSKSFNMTCTEFLVAALAPT